MTVPHIRVYAICSCYHIMLQIMLNNHLQICHILVNFYNGISKRQYIEIHGIQK